MLAESSNGEESEMELKGEVLEKLCDDALKEDAFELSFGDTIDVKTGIALAAIGFVGALSGIILFVPNMPIIFRLAQAVSILAMSVSVVLAFVALWPLTYLVETTVDQLERWISELALFYEGERDAEAKILEEMSREKYLRAKQRITANREVNSRKLVFMSWSLKTVFLASAIDITTLLFFAVRVLITKSS